PLSRGCGARPGRRARPARRCCCTPSPGFGPSTAGRPGSRRTARTSCPCASAPSADRSPLTGRTRFSEHTPLMQPNLLDRDLYAGDPWPTYAWLRANAPVYWDPASELWALLLHEDVVWAEKHSDVF